MNVIVLLIACSLLAAACFLIAFLRALSRGQFDDLATPPIRMLFDSESNGTESSDDEDK